ncbi:unnamed protein product [Vitrella brassicaformis CCMP3155]|uniref:Uncharacterized protein n=1 Tax=Vitrella brassicaformis (strain CCMP3155) TaxID=1169540 RepID=A0A0G4EIP6_VITBC|nr:unnamed protein product [Vitrella brassicaformis CCMP3155]|eukprot:CEL95885.1 unnamed protein product [Vitrella brassicaformis CCMP3155]
MQAVCVMFAPLPFADSSESEEDETPLLTTSLLLTALLTFGVCCLKSGSQPCVYLGAVPVADSGVMQALDEVERHLKAIPWTKCCGRGHACALTWGGMTLVRRMGVMTLQLSCHG